MTKINPQATELNNTIKATHPQLLDMLSPKGKAIFFPKKGILGQSAQAKGKEINGTIGIALENDGSPMRLSTIDRNINLESRDAYPYAPSYGKPELRKKWQELIYRKNPSLNNNRISLPVVTCALTHGLSISGYLFIEEGEDILVPDMFYGNYKLIFGHGYGAGFDQFRFFKKNRLDLDSFRKKVMAPGTNKKNVILNFPNNPCGYTPTIEETKEIKQILLDAANMGNHLVVLLDDAYFGLVFRKGIYEESIFAELADLHENILAIKIDGATKEDYVWGFRVGFITYAIKGGTEALYNALEAKTAGAVRGNISNAPHLSQSLILESLLSDKYNSEKTSKYELLKQRFDRVNTILNEHQEYKEYFEAVPFNSGYFLCVKLKKTDGEKTRNVLLERYSTGLIAINDMLRIAFSSIPTQKLDKLFSNIYQACRDQVEKPKS